MICHDLYNMIFFAEIQKQNYKNESDNELMSNFSL